MRVYSKRPVDMDHMVSQVRLHHMVFMCNLLTQPFIQSGFFTTLGGKYF